MHATHSTDEMYPAFSMLLANLSGISNSLKGFHTLLNYVKMSRLKMKYTAYTDTFFFLRRLQIRNGSHTSAAKE